MRSTYQAERQPYHYYTENRESVDNQDGLPHNKAMAIGYEAPPERKPAVAKNIQWPVPLDGPDKLLSDWQKLMGPSQKQKGRR
jgi:hypothetical protein